MNGFNDESRLYSVGTLEKVIDALKKSIPGELAAINDLKAAAIEHFKKHGYPTAIEGIDDDPEYSTEWVNNQKQ
jgi:hypothetical protein